MGSDKVFNEFDTKKLKNLNDFTDTHPAYRANLQIKLINGGYSSYQSEYPYPMTTRNGSITSPLSSLANKEADNNYIIIKNIFHEPFQETFYAYLVNYSEKKIEKKYILKSNTVNFIEIDNDLIKPDIFLVTQKYLGIPIYISVKNKSLSFEHTHPPHSYIVSTDKFSKVFKLKKELNEIISQ